MASFSKYASGVYASAERLPSRADELDRMVLSASPRMGTKVRRRFQL